MAIVVNIFINESYGSLQLDDGSGAIRVKVWNEDVPMLEKVSIGDLVIVIGTLNEFNDETYLRPEVVKKLENLDWAKLRKLELTKEFCVVEKRTEQIVQEETLQEPVPPTNENRGKIVAILEAYPDGVDMDEFLKKINLDEKEVELILEELLKEGEVFQPRPNVIKMV